MKMIWNQKQKCWIMINRGVFSLTAIAIRNVKKFSENFSIARFTSLSNFLARSMLSLLSCSSRWGVERTGKLCEKFVHFVTRWYEQWMEWLTQLEFECTDAPSKSIGVKELQHCSEKSSFYWHAKLAVNDVESWEFTSSHDTCQIRFIMLLMLTNIFTTF